MTYTFQREGDGGTIILPVIFSGIGVLKFLLDTGASYTTVDFNTVLMAGFDLRNPDRTVLVETSNGVIEAELFELESLSALGLTRRNVEVQMYDFLKRGIRSNYQGVLGLDFFEGTKFTVNMVENTIEVESLTNT